LVSVTVNAFKLRTKVSEIDVPYTVFKVENFRIAPSEDRYKVLNNIARKLGEKLKTVALRYTPDESFNGVVVFGMELNECISIDGFELKPENWGHGLGLKGLNANGFFYELLRSVLEYRGYWSSSYNRYYQLFGDAIVDNIRIFCGVFFRFEILSDGTVLLVLDPIARMVSNKTMYELAAEWGLEEAKRRLAGRYVVVDIVKRGSISKALFKVIEFVPNLRAGVDKVIKINGKEYTVKEYYAKYRNLPAIADRIPGDAPLIKVQEPNSNSVFYIASSMAYLNYRTNDIPSEYIEEIEKHIYLSADSRLQLTKEFLSTINPLKHPERATLGALEFESEPLILGGDRAGIYDAPELKFGRGERKVDLQRYTEFFRNALKELGVAKRIDIPTGKAIAVVYPEDRVDESDIKEFYNDVSKAAAKIFEVKLPREPLLWGYRKDPSIIARNHERFKNKVVAALLVFRSECDELYDIFKRIFEGIATQGATVQLLKLKKQQFKKKRHKYKNAILNLTSGLLGKLGVRPWLLKNPLKARAYIGIDVMPNKAAAFTLMDGYGNYIAETWIPLKGAKIGRDDMSKSIHELLLRSLRILGTRKELSLVFMRDGDVYDEELEGIRMFAESSGSVSQYAVVSVKKKVPYRIYELDDGNMSSPHVGSFAVLGRRHAVLASSGRPLIKRMAKPLLIELVEVYPGDWYTVQDATYESYLLSFLHWASLTHKTKYPAPIKCANDFSELASRGIVVRGPPL